MQGEYLLRMDAMVSSLKWDKDHNGVGRGAESAEVVFLGFGSREAPPSLQSRCVARGGSVRFDSVAMAASTVGDLIYFSFCWCYRSSRLDKISKRGIMYDFL